MPDVAVHPQRVLRPATCAAVLKGQRERKERLSLTKTAFWGSRKNYFLIHEKIFY
jgi:hypothetical protein